MCPFGSAFMNESVQEKGGKELSKDFNIHGYDPEAPDSDDDLVPGLEK